MKPSHLAFLAAAALGVGGISSAAVADVSAPTISNKIAIRTPGQRAVSAMNFIMGAQLSGDLRCSYQRKNQRQIRLARRRSFAAGNRKAFG